MKEFVLPPEYIGVIAAFKQGHEYILSPHGCTLAYHPTDNYVIVIPRTDEMEEALRFFLTRCLCVPFEVYEVGD